MGIDPGFHGRLTAAAIERIAQMKDQEPTRLACSKRVLHLDMDAFFAAIEQRDYPLLRNKPVIVGGPVGSRGVVSTCSYEARRYGVKSAMPLHMAQKLCSTAIFIPPNGRKYVHVSRQVMSILQQFSPKVEPVSVDEAFMDVTGLARLYGNEIELARKIKAAIRQQLQLTASIGIAPTKILAKLASGLQKPDGLAIIKQDEIEKKVFILPVENLWGIGKATTKTLAQMGIITIGDLAKYSEIKLKKVFGKNGPLMVQAAAGKLDLPVLSLTEIPLEKSVGHEHTFWNDTADLEEIRAQMLLLVQRVGRRLRRKKLQGRTITCKLRYDNFQTLTHRTSFNRHTNNEAEIFAVAKELFHQAYEDGRKIRLIGISVSNLVPEQNDVIGLPFIAEQMRIKSDEQLYPAIDKIKDTYGEHAIWRACNFEKFDEE